MDRNKSKQYKLEVSFLEIYNDALRDLLNPKSQASLRVREHPKSGPYVEHLQWLAVGTVHDVSRILNQGYRHRTTASTMMNDESSRSHAIFQAIFTQIEETTEGEGSEEESRKRSEKVSKISLVDLAGSERQSSETLNQSQMDRLNEG
jgi:kinesin family protein 1